VRKTAVSKGEVKCGTIAGYSMRLRDTCVCAVMVVCVKPHRLGMVKLDDVVVATIAKVVA